MLLFTRFIFIAVIQHGAAELRKNIQLVSIFVFILVGFRPRSRLLLLLLLLLLLMMLLLLLLMMLLLLRWSLMLLMMVLLLHIRGRRVRHRAG